MQAPLLFCVYSSVDYLVTDNVCLLCKDESQCIDCII